MAKTTHARKRGNNGKNKGHIALYFPKWCYLTTHSQNRHTRQTINKIKG